MKSRLAALAFLFIVAFGILLGRLVDLQVVHGEEYERKVNESSRRVELVRAPRGAIVDRKDRPLAVDVPTYRLEAVLADLDPSRTLCWRLAKILRKPLEWTEARWVAAAAVAETATAASASGGASDDDPEGAIPLVTAPSPASVKAFRSLIASSPFDGLALEGPTLTATPALLLQRPRTLARLSRLCGLDVAAAERRLDAASRRADAARDGVERAARLTTPVVLTSSIPFEITAEVEEEGRLYPGIQVDVVPERRNPYGEVAGHVLGSVGAPRPTAVEAFGVPGSVDMRAGLDGVEASRNLVLAGTPGARIVEWDRRARERSVLAEEQPQPGATVRLSIDIEVQRATEAALDEQVRRYAAKGKGGGAAVLLDCRTGEVLAIASAPRYDPSRLARDFASLSCATPSALLHRAIAAEIPPGSIMKLLTSAAALESGAIDDRTTIFCKGYLHTRRAFKCLGYHADINLRGALARSCNIFFYTVGELLHEEKLTAWARAFGFGAPTGIDLPGERRGLVPSTAWKRARNEAQEERVRQGERARDRAAAEAAQAALLPGAAGLAAFAQASEEVERREARLAQARDYLERTRRDVAWTPGDDRNTAIGQGNLLVTPLQIGRLAAAVASRGKLFRPKLFLGAEQRAAAAPAEVRALDGDGAEGATETALDADTTDADPDETTADPLRTIVDVCDVADMPVAPATWESIRAGMIDCVNASYGTAHKSGLSAFRAAAKTGTAQAPGGSHAWVAGFAPAEAPEVAFAVVVEYVADGVHGGDVAGPAAAKMLAAYEASKAPPPLAAADTGGEKR